MRIEFWGTEDEYKNYLYLTTDNCNLPIVCCGEARQCDECLRETVIYMGEGKPKEEEC